MEQTKKTIALTWGATGGHAIPLVSVYNFIKDAQSDGELATHYDFIWVWEAESLEEELAQKHNIPFYDISAGKIRRYFDWKNFYEPLKNLTGFFEGLYYIWKYKVDIVFSKGWYVSLPLCIAAWVMRKDIYIHESDTVTGLANKVISRFATKVFYTFKNDLTHPPVSDEESEGIDEDTTPDISTPIQKYIHTGPIVNPELIDYLDSLEVEENERFTIMVIAGSQWSSTIFQALLKSMPDMWDIDFHVILGEKNMHFRKDFERYPNVIAHDFITQKRLWKILKNVDIAITRWSSVLWELYFFGIHSIIIPLEATGGNHQFHNATYFKEKFWSNILTEDPNLNIELFRHIQKYKEMRKSGLNIDGFFDGLNTIVKEMEL